MERQVVARIVIVVTVSSGEFNSSCKITNRKAAFERFFDVLIEMAKFFVCFISLILNTCRKMN